jgi:hypothetical protein
MLGYTHLERWHKSPHCGCPTIDLACHCVQTKPEVLVLDVKELEHSQHTAAVLDRAMRTRDMDNERFLRKVRARLDACVFSCTAVMARPS